VNITKVNVTTVNVERVVYKNVRVTNAVTVIHRDTFVSGRHVDTRVQENPFLRDKVHVGRPDIRPEQATKMPVVREIPMDKRPPPAIREVKVKEIKETRPLVRQKEASVMRPGSLPREMNVRVREGTPEGRAQQKPGQPSPGRMDLGKPGGSKTLGREIGKSGPEKIPEKAGEVKPAAKGVEKPRISQPVDRSMERSKDLKGVVKESEKPRVQPQTQRKIENSQPAQPVTKGFEKQVPARVPEKGFEKPAASRVPEKRVEQPKAVEKEIEKGGEPRQMERGMRGPEGKGR
jgi:hypothetical protein